MAEVCEGLGVASEPRTVSAGRRPVMEIGGVPYELIGWMSKRGREIDLCRQELEHEYVTAVDEDGNLRFGPVVSEQARTKLNRIAARKTRPPKPEARSLAQLRTDRLAAEREGAPRGGRASRRQPAGAGPDRGRRDPRPGRRDPGCRLGGSRRQRDGVRDERQRPLPPSPSARRGAPVPRPGPARPP
ncbi:relaxase domain-containing protein [Streptomyces sp. NPDC057325]|uniref:relaxase domain-containing protein n=1 Tax=unclassified Streptomyces TaxID=2593676 RepID=UPI0036337546